MSTLLKAFFGVLIFVYVLVVFWSINYDMTGHIPDSMKKAYEENKWNDFKRLFHKF